MDSLRSIWGWAGVILFFALSGFLITSILLTTRDKPHYFHNFHARRALRIWPVYHVAAGGGLPERAVVHRPQRDGRNQDRAVAGVHLSACRISFTSTLPPAIGPTWALAIEEQYYFVWAPLVQVLAPAVDAGCGADVRARRFAVVAPRPSAWLTPTTRSFTSTALHWGSLLAIGLHTLPLSRRTWLWIGLGGFVLGISAAATIAGGTAYLDSALAVGFVGGVLALIASTGARNPINDALRRGPLAFYGRISYGLYMIHISVFIYFGWFDLAHGPLRHPGQPCGRGLPAGSVHAGRRRALVRF